MAFCIDHILVFKTSISTPADVFIIGPVLDNHDLVLEWSADTEDVDHVLRVISPYLTPAAVIGIISACGYHCEELKDEIIL